MVEYSKESIFDLKVDIIVNPVNCRGISGAGLALEFKKRFPANYQAYSEYCDKNLMIPGDLFVYDNGGIIIFNVATKDDWGNPSKLEWIQDGIDYMANEINYRNTVGYDLYNKRRISSIAIPKLGCGFGGLNWSDVKPIIESIEDTLMNCKVIVCDR